jgi:putative membrane protein
MRSLPVAALLVASSAYAADISQSDRTYLTNDAQGASYELQASQLAQQKAQSTDVKNYANMIVADHEKYNTALQSLAQSKGVTLPTSLTRQQEQRLGALRGATGRAFDAAYVREMRRVNDDDRAEESRERDATSDADIKHFIEQFRATDAKHASAAKDLGGASVP